MVDGDRREEMFGGQHGVDDRKRAEPVRVTPMNRRAEKDALHAPTEKCVRVLVEKNRKHS
jgi:hypothetical protein